MAQEKQSGIGSQLMANAGGILGTIGGWLGIGEKKQDKRQLKQQTALNAINEETAKRMADYENEGKMKMWKDTNYGAVLEQAELAGVSKAAALGGGTGGTQGASVANAGGGSAADAAATTNAKTASIQQSMQLASQLALQKAQKENIEADTANKQAETENKGVQTAGGKIANEVAGATKEDAIRTIQETANKALAEAVQSQQKQVINEETMKEQIKTIQEEALNKILTNKGLTIENKKKQAELAVKKFEATMANEGLSPNSPWYVKWIGDYLSDKNIKEVSTKRLGQAVRDNVKKVNKKGG